MQAIKRGCLRRQDINKPTSAPVNAKLRPFMHRIVRKTFAFRGSAAIAVATAVAVANPLFDLVPAFRADQYYPPRHRNPIDSPIAEILFFSRAARHVLLP